MIKRKLPVSGIQTFSKLRNENYVYIDKTAHVYDIVSRYNVVFLARPRRFGKSLLCSTFEALFLGQKELFEGLAISKTDWDWKAYPVIHLGLGASNFTKINIDTLVDTSKCNKEIDFLNYQDK